MEKGFLGTDNRAKGKPKSVKEIKKEIGESLELLIDLYKKSPEEVTRLEGIKILAETYLGLESYSLEEPKEVALKIPDFTESEREKMADRINEYINSIKAGELPYQEKEKQRYLKLEQVLENVDEVIEELTYHIFNSIKNNSSVDTVNELRKAVLSEIKNDGDMPEEIKSGLKEMCDRYIEGLKIQ